MSRVGGLAETVIDANDAAIKAGVATGVQFTDITAEGVLGAVHRTVPLHRRRETWQRIQAAGMRADVGRQTSAADYAALCRLLCKPKESA